MSAAQIARHGRTVSITVDNRSVDFGDANANWVRQALEAFLTARGLPRRELADFGDNLVSKGGGTDFEPKVWLSNSDDDGGSRGSLWLDEDQARAVASALA